MGHDITASHFIKVVRQTFCRTGAPNIFWSEEGPQCTSNKFRDCARQWGFTHIRSIPWYHQSNGKIKATVKSMKKIIHTFWNSWHLDKDKLCHALLQYRNTSSCKDGLLLAQKVYGQPVQDMLPAHRWSVQTSGSKVQRRLKRQPHITGRKQKLFRMLMHITSLRFKSDITLLPKTQRPSYGTSMA